MKNRFSLDRRCLCVCDGGRNKIGFTSLGPWAAIESCLSGYGYIMVSNLIHPSFDNENFSKYKIIFEGGLNSCGPSPLFNESKWDKVRRYILGGGRLWVNGEFQGCLGNPSRFNNFLSTLGSSMVWTGGASLSGCNHPCSPASANIAQGITFKAGKTANISGGTPCFTTNDEGFVILAVEQLGSGFLFATGDSNIFDVGSGGFGGCGHPHCPLTERLVTYTNNQII